MSVDLEAIGACPRCRGSLGRAAKGYVCQGCGALWPVVKGVPRFVDSEHYVGSFGWEWRRHKRTQIDDASSKESELTFAQKTGLRPEDVRGKLVLDVGVGSGRFSHVVARWGGIPVGIDLSLAVLSAKKNLAPFAPNALVCQADAFKLPFKEETFDIVFSIGVLHHTPSTRDAFRHVARFVKPGGTVAIGVYDAISADYFDLANRYRRYTTELPHSLLHFLSYAAIPFQHVLDATRAVAGADTASALKKALPLVEDQDPLVRVLNTFDWFSPRYQWLHLEADVRRWFEELGFEDVRSFPPPMVCVRGRRPASGPLREPAPSTEQRRGELAPLPAWVPAAGPLRTPVLAALLAGEVARALAVTAPAIARPAVTKLVVTAKHALGIRGDILGRERPT